MSSLEAYTDPVPPEPLEDNILPLEATDWSQVYAKYYSELVGTLAYRIQDPNIAADLVQETFISAMSGNFATGTNMRSWLHQIARNKLIDETRRRGRRREVELYRDDGSINLTSEEETSQSSTIQVEERLVALQALNGLEPDFSKAVVLRAAGFSHSEIAEELDILSGTAKSRISRGRKALAASMNLAETDAAA